MNQFSSSNDIRSHHRQNSNNRLSLGSWFNPNEYDFLKEETKIQHSNSLKQKNISTSSSSNYGHNKKNLVEPDSISEMAFPMITRRFSNHMVNRFRKKQRANSININPADIRDDILNFDGVLFYLSASNGLAGSLTVNSKKIVFTSGLVEHNKKYNNHIRTQKHNFLKPPAPSNPIQDTEDENFYEIDLMNIAELSKEVPTTSTERTIIYIHCRNFKHAKIGLRQSSADSLYKRLIMDHQLMNCNSKKLPRSCLWEYLHDTYHYRVRSDWFKYEKWYVNNFKIQFSQFNEFDGMCPTLPEIVIVPRRVDDKELESIVNISDGLRVPVITYLYRQSGHMIIRSTTFNGNRVRLHNLFKEKIFDSNKIPLKEYDISLEMPSLEEIDKSHLKLRKACFKTVKMNQQNHITIHYDIDNSKQFWSKCSSWLCTLAKVLKFTTKLVDTLKRRASIGLIEKFDSNWNCLLSSLVQICLDPEKRTIKGFESLLSKEWLYISGYKRLERGFGFGNTKLKSLNDPNHILFLLFLDAIHQLIVQNSTSFEFSTFYLILLLDYQVNSDLFTKDKFLEFETNKSHAFILNPLFAPTQKILRVKTHVTHMKFFTKLYFRSLASNISNRFTSEELLYITELESRMLI